MLPGISVVVNIAALVAALWFTFGGLGYRRGLTRLGATLLTAAAVFWTEPVLRTIYLGQVNLVLMALIIWDLCQPDLRRSGASRWWKGAGVGVAAGIKLVPLIFIPYLLLTRRFRAAAVACAVFAATVAAGVRWSRPPIRPGGGWAACSSTAAGPVSSAGRATSRCGPCSPGWRAAWPAADAGVAGRGAGHRGGRASLRGPAGAGPAIRCPGCWPAR